MKEGLTTIVLLNWNNLEEIRDCLASLARLELPVNDRKEIVNKHPYEVIIVDNGSNDGSLEWLEKHGGEYNARVISAPNLSFATANNLGAKGGEGEYVCILNNDTIVFGGWLLALTSALEKEPSIGLAGAQILDGRGFIQFSGGVIEDLPTGKCNHLYDFIPTVSPPRECTYITGACMFLPRKVWEEVGGFDERFDPIFYEDVDLSVRVRRAGYRVAVVPPALLLHKVSRTLDRDPERKQRAIEVNRARFIDKWSSK